MICYIIDIYNQAKKDPSFISHSLNLYGLGSKSAPVGATEKESVDEQAVTVLLNQLHPERRAARWQTDLPDCHVGSNGGLKKPTRWQPPDPS